jgi:hypothetical protein
MSRGVLWITWGDDPAYGEMLERSQASVQRHHPGMPMMVYRPARSEWHRGLLSKCEMFFLSPYDTTLFLDADTVVLGDLTPAFEAAERHGLACCIGECPWLRRYGHDQGDRIEYNTGVVAFSRSAAPVFNRWQELAPSSPGSQWAQGDRVMHLERDDQWAFSRAIADLDFNPFVLPMGYNFRPGFHTRHFAPVKVWHSPHLVPPLMETYTREIEAGERLVTFCNLGG